MEETEEEINVCIKEYLEFNDLNATIVAFESELSARGKHLTDSSSSVVAEAKSNLIKALEDGDCEAFFDLWTQAIPAHTRKTEGQKIEFYINIYFAIFPVHPFVGGRGSWTGESSGTIKKPPLSRTMQIFQQYLSTKGAELSKTSAFLSFYALPYVPDPASHPSFQDIFTHEWVNEMKTRVNKFLDTSIKSSSKPRLYQLMSGNNSAQPSLSDRDLQYINTLEQTNQEYMRQHEKLQDDKNALLLITKEIIQQLQRTVDGQSTSPEYLKQIYSRVGPFLPQQQEATSKKIPVRVSPRARTEIQSSTQMLASLNYPLLQRDLHSLPAIQKCTILQALRWRISQSEIGVARKMVLQAYIQHDLLGCSSPKQILLNELLGEGSDPLAREYTTRLINTISFECAGRAYLTQNLFTVQLLFKLLQNENGDTITRQQAIGSLQKLSLRKSAQNCMIDLGIIDWLLDVLSTDVDSLSKYSLEYASALLLNLSLRPNGRRACESAQSHDILQVLSNLLENENTQVRFYTNGTLYSVLARPQLREKAKAIGMDGILKYLIQNSDENSAKQLEYILAQLHKEEDEDEEEDNSALESNDDGDENDMVADEEEQPETINNQNLAKGEQLLCSKYLVSSDQANKEAQAVRQSVQGSFNEEVYAFGSRNSLMNSTVPAQPTSHGLPDVFNSVTSLPPKQATQKPNSNKTQQTRQNRTPPRDRITPRNSNSQNETPLDDPSFVPPQATYSAVEFSDESQAFNSRQRVVRTPINENIKLEPLKPARVHKNVAKGKK